MKRNSSIRFGVEALEPVVAPLRCGAYGRTFIQSVIVGVLSLGLIGYYEIFACL